MRRFLAVAIFSLPLALAACSSRDNEATPTAVPSTPTGTATSTATGPTSTSTPTQGVNGPSGKAFDADNALEQIRMLSQEIGERVSGTQGERDATQYIRDQLTSFGYSTRIIDFEYDGERFGLSTIELPELTVSGFTLVGSGTGTAVAPLAYAGLGRPADLAERPVDGKIALLDRGEISFRDKYEAAREAGAIGMVVINSEPGSLWYGNLDTRATFPAISVAGDAGQALMTAADSAVPVTLTVPDNDRAGARNVLASVDDSGCDILVGAHHDTVPGVTGANDNASGVAHVLELARVLAADGLDRGLCFATFGAEEDGLFGSENMVSMLQEEGDLPGLMVNLDVTGAGSEVQAIGEAGLQDELIALGKELDVPVVAARLPPNTGSDHQSFQAAGVPVLFVTSGNFDQIHTPADTFSLIDPAEVERVGVALEAFLREKLAEIAPG